MTRLASITVGRRGVQTRHALVCSTAGSAHRYELSICNPRLLRGLQEQVHGFLRSGLLPQRRLVTRTAQSKSHRSHRIRRNASGSVQTTLSKLSRPRRLRTPTHFCRRGSPDRDLSFLVIKTLPSLNGSLAYCRLLGNYRN